MKLKGLMGVMMLATVAGAGCGSVVTDGAGSNDGSASSGDGASVEQCKKDVKPQESFRIVQCPSSGGTASINGTFETVAGGYHIVGTTETVEVQDPGTTPAIPTATLVHMVYSCDSKGSFGRGYFVALQNLPKLAEKTNPTEEGDRLWFAGVSGNDPVIPDDALPFTASLGHGCSLYSYLADPNDSEPIAAGLFSLDIKGAGSSTSIAPGEEGDFSVPSGAHAGNYRIKNVYIQNRVEGISSTVDESFTVSRTD